ncbi:MAG: Dps family protein [Pseudobdellovibrionaceae bacterium]
MASNTICTNLARTLADEYTLTLKTQNFHWNVEGPMFYSLHLLFEQQYTAMQLIVDRVAERIRALGEKAPGSYEEFKKISKVQDASPGKLSAHQMIDILVEDHETLLKDIHQSRKLADQAGDASTATLYDELALFHDKAAWMIRSQRS